MSLIETIRRGFLIWRDDVDNAAAELPILGNLFARQWRVLRISAGAITYTDAKGQSLELSLSDTANTQKQALAQLSSSGPLVVRLAASMGFKRDASFPIAAKNHLTEAVSLALPRLSPLPAEDVAFAMDTAAISETEGRISLPVYMARKSVIQEAVSKASALGLKASAVDLETGADQTSPGFDLREGHRAPSSGRSAFAFFFGLTALLVLLGLAFSLDNTLRLDPAYQDARRPASIEARLQAAITHAQAKSRSGSAVAALSDLSRRLPDGAYITDFAYENGEVRLTGLAWDAAAALRALDAAEEFDGAAFNGATIRDEDSGRERFEITARHLVVVEGASQ